MAKTRAKFGFLSYKDMLLKIENGTLDEYDINYTPDTHEQYLVLPDKTPMAIKSRVYVFDSTAEAYEFLNSATDTYNGQIVSIKVDNVYKAYIVNTNLSGHFYTVPLSATDDVDYNNLSNRPIFNLIGTLDTPLILSELTNGFYNVSGQYKISESIGTTFLSTNPSLYVIEHTDEITYIRNITASTVTVYTIKDGEVSTSTVVTTDMLGNFITTEYLDAKLEALDYLTKDDVQTYVNELLDTTIEVLVEQKLNEILDEGLDEKISTIVDEKIIEADSDSIFNLFGN